MSTEEFTRGSGGQLSAREQERRVQRAIAHVNSLWLPVHRDTYQKIQEGLEDGRYELSLSFLLADLKTDIALYLYLIRELSRSIHTKVPLLNLANPLSLLEAAGLSEIKKALSVSPSSISRHGIESMTSAQASRLQATLISSAAAETCASATGVDPGKAHLTAVLRQLGLSLISWNYPSIYEQAVQALAPGREIEEILQSMLGFSPTLLAVRVVHDWGIDPTCKLSMIGDTENKGGKKELSPAVHNLKKLCLIGEALARANQPQLYPTAQTDWAYASNAIQEILGSSGLASIAQSVQSYASSYYTSHPEIFSDIGNLHAEHRIVKQLYNRIQIRNPWLERCEPLFKKRVRESYEISLKSSGTLNNTSNKITSSDVSSEEEDGPILLSDESQRGTGWSGAFNHLSTSFGPELREALGHLKAHAMPAGGFRAVRVFSVDPATNSLFPHLTYGESQLYSKNEPISTSSSLTKTRSPGLAVGGSAGSRSFDRNPVAQAFTSDSYLLGRCSNEQLLYLAAKIGIRERVGVLYAEIENILAEKEIKVIHFRALLQTLMDLLKVS